MGEPKLQQLYTNNLVLFPTAKPQQQPTTARKRPTATPFKSDGRPKANAADPIRNPADITAIQEYFLERGNTRDYTLFSLGISFGLRAGDLLKLRLCDLYKPDGSPATDIELYEHKTGKKNRIRINSRCREILLDYIRQQQADHDVFDDDPVFASREHDCNGELKPISLSLLSKNLKAAAKACGVEGHISSHSLRKTFVYQSIQANKGDWDALFAIQHMLNHSSFKTTLRYCGADKDKEDNIRESIAGLI